MKKLIIAAACIAAVTMIALTGCGKDEPPKESKKEAVLSFHSFDGGGPEYSVKIKDKIVSYTYEEKYSKPNHEELTGAGYDVIFRFKGLKEGETEITVLSQSPIAGNEKFVYTAKVDKDLNVIIKEKK